MTLRRLLRQRLRTSAIVVAIAVALTMITALSSIVDGLLFRPLPFSDPDRIVVVTYRDQAGQPPKIAYLPEFEEQRNDLRVRLQHSPMITLASQAGHAAFFLRDEERGLGLSVVGVDARFFTLLGLSPAVGRTFTVEDEQSPAARPRDAAAALPIVIGYGLWQRLYGGDPRTLGLHELAGRPVDIIGIMGRGVKFPGETNVWAPVSSVRPMPPAYVGMTAGKTVEQLESAFPELVFTPLREVVYSGQARTLVLLLGAVMALLVVTFVQAAALMFSQWVGDLREIGIRLALGATRVNIIQQFATESILTAGAALALAWLAVSPATTFIARSLPAEFRHGQYLDPDIRTFVLACSIAFVGFAVLTITPLSAFRQATPVEFLGRRVLGQAFKVERIRRALLFLQLSLTYFLLYLTGLASHSLLNASIFDYGFDAEHVLVFTPPPWAGPNRTTAELFADFAERNRKVVASVEALRHAPGVVGAANFYAAPLSVGLPERQEAVTHFRGRPLVGTVARVNRVGPDFVPALGARLISGQSFDRPDYSGRSDIAVVNETMARRLSVPVTVAGGAVQISVVGHPIQGEHFNATIIGVIDDLVDLGPATPPDPQVFLPDWKGSAAYGVAISVDRSIEEILPTLLGVLQGTWGHLSPSRVSLMRDELRTVLLPFRAQAMLLGLVAGCCLPIAGIGLVGALGQSVQLRSREIAVRIAIGGDPAAVRRNVIGQALIVLSLAILVGTTLGAVTGSFVAHQLFEVRPLDPSTIVVVTAGFLVIGWLAASVPARKASTIDPIEALRVE